MRKLADGMAREGTMARPATWLSEFRRDVYSQAGEDGVIARVLDMLAEPDPWCVECGAGDGETLSNTRNLILGGAYSAILIEADDDKFEALESRYSDNPRVGTVHRRVGLDQGSGLDAVLAGTPVPRRFELLSLDIDGNDFHVWQRMNRYQPKLVCIEFNPTIPTGVEFVQPPDMRVNQGASLSSIVELGKEKGYELVSVLHCNALLVGEEYFPLFEIDDNRPETLRTDTTSVTYIFAGYDGTVFLRGSRRIPWLGIDLQESHFQVLPRFLRRYPGSYSTTTKRFLRACARGYRAARRAFRLGFWL